MIAASLAACATTGDVMQRSPAVQFESMQSPAPISGCLAPRILKDWGQSKTSPNGRGTMIVVGGSAWGNPIAVIDIQATDPGARIAIRRGGGVSDRVFDGVVATARSCG